MICSCQRDAQGDVVEADPGCAFDNHPRWMVDKLERQREQAMGPDRGGAT